MLDCTSMFCTATQIYRDFFLQKKLVFYILLQTNVWFIQNGKKFGSFKYNIKINVNNYISGILCCND